MEAIREIREITSDTITIRVPLAFCNQRVEIIVLPLGVEEQSPPSWPAGFLEKFAGCMPDFPDIPEEPQLETRAPL
jgi:hypothetical protein